MVGRQVFQHYKDKRFYQLLFPGYDFECGTKLVVYQSLFPRFNVWARPFEMFYEKVNGVRRFDYHSTSYGVQTNSEVYKINGTSQYYQTFGTCRHTENYKVYQICQELHSNFHVKLVPYDKFQNNFVRVGDLRNICHLEKIDF